MNVIEKTESERIGSMRSMISYLSREDLTKKVILGQTRGKVKGPGESVGRVFLAEGPAGTKP